jgi:hypothetical protein
MSVQLQNASWEYELLVLLAKANRNTAVEFWGARNVVGNRLGPMARRLGQECRSPT